MTILNTPYATGSFLYSVFQTRPSMATSLSTFFASSSRSVSGPQGLISRMTSDFATTTFFFFAALAFSALAASSAAASSFPSSSSANGSNSSSFSFDLLFCLLSDFFGYHSSANGSNPSSLSTLFCGSFFLLSFPFAFGASYAFCAYPQAGAFQEFLISCEYLEVIDLSLIHI